MSRWDTRRKNRRCRLVIVATRVLETSVCSSSIRSVLQTLICTTERNGKKEKSIYFLLDGRKSYLAEPPCAPPKTGFFIWNVNVYNPVQAAVKDWYFTVLCSEAWYFKSNKVNLHPIIAISFCHQACCQHYRFSKWECSKQSSKIVWVVGSNFL